MSFEKTIGDICEKFSAAMQTDTAWETAQDIAISLGGNAVNVGVTARNGEILAARSGMSESWLAAYDAQQFYMVDPFLESLVENERGMSIDSGTLSSYAPQDCKKKELSQQLKDFGYGSLIANTFGGQVIGGRKMIVHCSELSVDETHRCIGQDRLHVIQAIIAAHVALPDDPSSDGMLRLGRKKLTQKEKDILSWLACGLRNDEIAFKAGIAEVTVRKHLISIRSKLGTSTREHAIAVAMRDALIEL